MSENWLRYYLGPTGIPDKLNALAQLVPMFADGQDYVDYYQAGGRTMNALGDRNLWGTVEGIGDMASAGAAMMLPGVTARAINEGVDVAGDLGRFVADESGALRAFHGSPHDFDRFRMDRIGTGEGAQAYGHGLYFAESEDVARGYRDDLSRNQISIEGQIYRPGMDAEDGVDALQVSPAAREHVRRMIGMGFPPEQAARRTGRSPEADAIADEVAQAIASGRLGSVSNPGRLYEVNINANPEDFLDWDAPLSAQPEGVRNAINDISPVRVFHSRLNDEYRAYLEGQGGILASYSSKNRDEAVNRAMQSLTGENIVRSDVPSMISSRLREAGIPGIRYLDAGSRGAGDGSRNYVVFDENLIEIVRKYGIAGAAATLGVSQADVAQAMEQGQQTDNAARIRAYLQSIGLE